MTFLKSLQQTNSTMAPIAVQYGTDYITAGYAKAKLCAGRGKQIGSIASIPIHASGAFLTIQSLNSQLKVSRPFEITIESIDGDFVASFAKANINASGDNIIQAIDNLIAMIEDLYLLFSDEVDRFGPEPAHQFSILQKHLSL